jgi:KDO2-lipid IV(A) lauroyltransferase
MNARLVSLWFFRLTLQPVFRLLGALPLPVVYRLSDALHFVVFRVFRYRYQVIRRNLSNSFPEKSAAERERIAVANERYFCDLFLETFKLLNWSVADLSRHVTHEGFELHGPALAEKKNLVFILGHMGNWEWYGAKYGAISPFQIFTIYHPLSSPGFDELLYGMRRRWRTRLIRMKGATRKIRRLVERDLEDRRPFVIGFIGDQSPRPEAAYWTRFLNQDTAVFRGVERTAREYDFPVVYASVRRPARGKYHVRLELLTDRPRELPEGEILERFIRRLESDIREQPEIWLWTHKRWKVKKPE